jgi:hypothetical protein
MQSSIYNIRWQLACEIQYMDRKVSIARLQELSRITRNILCFTFLFVSWLDLSLVLEETELTESGMIMREMNMPCTSFMALPLQVRFDSSNM